MRNQYLQANRKSTHRDAQGGYSPLLHTEHPHKSNADQHVIASGFADGWGERSEQIHDSECEAIQPIEKAEQEKQETGLIHDTRFSYGKQNFPQRRSRLRLRYGFGKLFSPFFKISNELNVFTRRVVFSHAEGRVAEVHFNTRGTAKGVQIQDHLVETIQPIEKAGLEQQNTGLIPVKNLFPCLGFAPRSQSLACCAYAQAGSICSLSGFAHFVRVIRPQIRYFLNPLFPCSKRAAFTLAEVLITLAVIGIVAALTLPGLIQNHNEKAWSTAKDLWEKKLTETVRRMNVDGVMTGHESTEDFMNTFKNYMKVIKTCDNTDINKCYSPKVVTTGKNDALEEIETNGLTSASSMGLKEWQTNTNTMSFVVADGTTVIMAYQPECPYADPIEDTGSQVSCMAYMVDVNGKKGPNRVGKDIQLSSGVAFSTCDNPIGDMCWSTDFAANTAIDTCSDTTYDKHGTDNQFCSTNYWAGAIKACKDKGMELPTGAQLAQLASELYVKSDGTEITIGANETIDSGLKVKDEYKANPPLTLPYPYWSSEEVDANRAYRRLLSTTVSYWYKTNKNLSNLRAICVSN